MKINGPNHSNFNPYQKQLNKSAEVKQQPNRQDKLEISKQAQEMHGSDKPDPARQKRVEQLKMDVESGNYKVDTNATAQKMIDFFSK